MAHPMNVSKADVELAKAIGVNIGGLTKKVAIAAMEDTIRLKVLGQSPEPASERQKHFASSLGIDISGHSRNIASAKISEYLDFNNRESIRTQNLQAGDHVRKIYGDAGNTYIISSIQSDGVVWFKGGQGQKSWASNVKKVTI